MTSVKGKRRLLVLAMVAAGYTVATVIATREGYSLGLNAFVRCRRGHLFTTTWIPGASLKAVRLGPWRLAACLVVASGAACLGLRR